MTISASTCAYIPIACFTRLRLLLPASVNTAEEFTLLPLQYLSQMKLNTLASILTQPTTIVKKLLQGLASHFRFEIALTLALALMSSPKLEACSIPIYRSVYPHACNG